MAGTWCPRRYQEEGFDEAHVVIAKEEEDDPRDDEYHDVQRNGENT